ncbi:hypothetical protein [uncultured Parolsenella sp.]|uniref:hypothetical protein n=1 Tax=uncultured Parolsenella sp. TaxID=2083008 RepID=UPI0025CD898B|nr:hypothetical protein [uncultured Parolsenella sp.]
MTDLENGILKMLKAEGTACPPALLAFRMPTYSFNKIVASIRRLESQGVLRVGSTGVELVVDSNAADECRSAGEVKPDTVKNDIETRDAKAASNEDEIIAESELQEDKDIFEASEAMEPAKSNEALDLNDRIVDLLKKSGSPTPPSFIAFQLPGVQFQEVAQAVSELKAQGVVEVISEGVQLAKATGRNGVNGSTGIEGAITAEPPSVKIQPHVNRSATISSEPKPKQMQVPSPILGTTEEEHHQCSFVNMSNSEIDSIFETLQSNMTAHSTTYSDTTEVLLGNRYVEQEPSTSEPAEEESDGPQSFRPLRYSDSINLLGLSTRTVNVLGNNEFLTILDLALCESPGTVKGLGRLGIEEIRSSLKKHAVILSEAEHDRLASWYQESIPTDGLIFDQFGTLRSIARGANQLESDRQGGECSSDAREQSTKSLGLSDSTLASLRRAGVLTAGKLCTYSENDLVHLFKLSRRQTAEVVEVLLRYGAHLAPKHRCGDEEPDVFINTPRQIATLGSSAWTAAKSLEEQQVPLYEPMSSLWLNCEFDGIEASSESIEKHLDTLLNVLSSSIQVACESVISCWVAECRTKMEDGHAESQTRIIPSTGWWQNAATTAGRETSELQYLPGENRLLFSPSTLHDWIESLPDDNAANALKKRLDGLTLEEAGSELGVTREGVRQLQERLLNKAPVLREDIYAPLFEKYKVDQALFCKIANCGPEVYRYLELRHHGRRRQTSHIAAAQQDTSVPESAREAISAYLVTKSHKGMVQIDGVYVRADRRSAVLYAMKRLTSLGSEVLDTETLYSELEGFVKEYDFPKSMLPASSRNLFAWIQRTGFIMAPMQKHLRLHDFSDYEYDDLRDCLEVMAELNIECSAQLIFETWPDVMFDLDIRDCNELHYTIKTQLGDKCQGVYSLGRNPMVTLGEADRSEQIKELIEEMAPVSRNDLAEEYNRRYKVSQASFLASFLGDFQQYRSGNIYSIKSMGFTNDERDYVLSILDCCDYFSLSLARQQFRGTFPASKAAICDESLQPLGYSITQSLVVKDGVNIRQAFVKMIEGLDKFKEGDDGFSPDVFAHSQLASELNMRLRSLSLVECGPRQYVKTEYLTKMYDVTKADIEQFIHVVSSSIPAGEPFTVQRLRGMGLSHKVDNALVTGEFDDGLLQGMLSAGPTITGFRTSSIGNVTLFCSGVNSIDAPRYIESVIQREGALELEDLLDILDREDGIATTAPILRQLIQRSTLFCVPSLDEMVFSSENDYNDYINDLLNG